MWNQTLKLSPLSLFFPLQGRMRALRLSLQPQSSPPPRSRTLGRCRSKLTPVAAASSARLVVTAVTSDLRRDRLVGGGVSTSTSTSIASSPSLPPSSRARAATGPAVLTAASISTSKGSGPSSDEPSSASPPRLVLYSKQNCPLCQGLEEKVRAALARGAFLPGSKLRGVELEIRDIESKAEWNAAFAMAVPVLFWRKSGGCGGAAEEKEESPVPRSPPRVTVEKLSRTLEAAMPLE